LPEVFDNKVDDDDDKEKAHQTKKLIHLAV